MPQAVRNHERRVWL